METIAGLPAIITALLGWMAEVLDVLISSPYAYFIGLAIIGALLKQAKKLAPAKR